MKPHHHQRPRLATAAALSLIAAMGCGRGNDGTKASASADDPPTSTLTTEMLSEGYVEYQPPAQEIPIEELGFDFGSDDAPISVIEFSDYGCGYCRRFHTATFPTLMKDYIETGKVRWKYVTYVSGTFANSPAAAFVAECAGEQGHFARLTHLLYERQPDWSRLGDPFPVFTEILREAGADPDRLQACIDEERPKARLRSGIVSGQRMGLRGTPHFLVDGVPVMGAQPLEWWVEFFTAIGAEAEEEAGAGGEPSGREPPP